MLPSIWRIEKQDLKIPTFIFILAKKIGAYVFLCHFPSLSKPSIHMWFGSILPIHMAASLKALVQGIRYCAFWCQVQSQVPIYEPVYKK